MERTILPLAGPAVDRIVKTRFPVLPGLAFCARILSAYVYIYKARVPSLAGNIPYSKDTNSAFGCFPRTFRSLCTTEICIRNRTFKLFRRSPRCSLFYAGMRRRREEKCKASWSELDLANDVGGRGWVEQGMRATPAPRGAEPIVRRHGPHAAQFAAWLDNRPVPEHWIAETITGSARPIA